MSHSTHIGQADPRMWRASERFPLAGTRRVAAVLPDDLSVVPFGLTRVVTVESVHSSNLNEAQVTYDPITQMSKIDDEFVILAGTMDTWCREDTIFDMQRFSDNNRDDAVEG